jgi:hypothetical protein
MNTYSELCDLQLEQQRHDDVAHRDILSLDVQDRVKHMVLHFAKYSGYFVTAQETRDQVKFVATLVDTFIICLACANALRFRLNDLLRDEGHSFFDLGAADKLIDMTWFIPRFAKATGSMAKACESMDHFERLDYHAILEKGLVEIASMCIAAAQKANVNLSRLTRDRWTAVERKVAYGPETKSDSVKAMVRKL